jgi:hypothetical protein
MNSVHELIDAMERSFDDFSYEEFDRFFSTIQSYKGYN